MRGTRPAPLLQPGTTQPLGLEMGQALPLEGALPGLQQAGKKEGGCAARAHADGCSSRFDG